MGAIVVLSILPWSACAQEKQPLIWGADAEGGAPYIFPDPSDPSKNIGFEVDLATALAKELGRPIVFKQYPFAKLTDGVSRGDIDLAMNGIEITPDREELVLFTKPYYAFRLQLVVRDDEDRFDSLQGIKDLGGVVGTLEDTAASRLLDRRKIRKQIYDGQIEPYKDLIDKVIDGVLLDDTIALFYAKKSMVTPEAPPLKFASPIVGRGYYAIALNKDNRALKTDLDVALTKLFEDGTLRRIYQKWGMWNDSQEEFLPSGQFFEPDEKADTGTTAPSHFIWLLLEGAWMTVKLTALSFSLAMLIGLPIALMRIYGPAPLRWFALLYVEFFRGIPTLLVLVFLYFALPEIARVQGWDESGFTLKMTGFWAAILGFGLSYAAYEAEIYRAGISSVPKGQWEAAGSLGMSRGLTFRRIILPQAVRVILPPMTNDLVALFKDTSVVSVIAVVELTKWYLILTKSSPQSVLEVALATAGLYLVMSVPLGYLSRYLEHKWGKQP